jgi:hypothetical protein
MQLPPHITQEIDRIHELRMTWAITQAEYAKRRRQVFSQYGIRDPNTGGRPGMALAVCTIVLAIIIGAIYGSTPFGERYGGAGGATLGAMLGLFLYLLPAFIAYQRSHAHRHAILVLNIFVGWTFIGWVGALVWSATSSRSNQYMPY